MIKKIYNWIKRFLFGDGSDGDSPALFIEFTPSPSIFAFNLPKWAPVIIIPAIIVFSIFSIICILNIFIFLKGYILYFLSDGSMDKDLFLHQFLLNYPDFKLAIEMKVQESLPNLNLLKVDVANPTNPPVLDPKKTNDIFILFGQASFITAVITGTCTLGLAAMLYYGVYS